MWLGCADLATKGPAGHGMGQRGSRQKILVTYSRMITTIGTPRKYAAMPFMGPLLWLLRSTLRGRGRFRRGPRRFWQHHIRDEADFAAHVRFCWANGLMGRAVNRPYSSIHRDMRLGRRGPVAEGCSRNGIERTGGVWGAGRSSAHFAGDRLGLGWVVRWRTPWACGLMVLLPCEHALMQPLAACRKGRLAEVRGPATYLLNRLYFTRFGSTASGPRRRILSCS